MPDGGTFALT